jgi:uncharacterized protein (DUF1697 family)
MSFYPAPQEGRGSPAQGKEEDVKSTPDTRDGLTMQTWVAFLRGINVGGNTMVSMKDLASMCTHIGFGNVRTYLNSGNIIFTSSLTEKELQQALEKELSARTGKEIGVVIRNSEDLEQIVKDNPFPEAVPSKVGILLGLTPVPKTITAQFIITGSEKVVPGKREVFIHYPDGMGRSKLKNPPSLKGGTMRNINTLAGLVSLIAKN